MTDPDTIAAFHAARAVRDTTSDTIEGAVLDHVEDRGSDRPPTDDEVFDGVPKEIPDVPTAPMRVPSDVLPNPFAEDDDWEDAETVVRKVPELRKPHDPTGCMM